MAPSRHREVVVRGVRLAYAAAPSLNVPGERSLAQLSSVLGQSMANPLFYERIVPLDSSAHRKLCIRPLAAPYAFASHANLIPALVAEFGAAAPSMPVAFLPGAEKPAAVFVTGFKPDQNVFVGADGKWTGDYVPAYLRRYPFIMGDVPNGQPILCIDASAAALGDEGVKLFSHDGKPEPALTQALQLADDYRINAQRTDEFCIALQRLKLFRSVTLDAKQPDGQSTVVHGLLVVDEQALDGLASADLEELHRQRWLRPIYAHLLSLGSLSRLSERLKPS